MVVLLQNFLPISHFERLSSDLQNLTHACSLKEFYNLFSKSCIIFSYENAKPPECLSLGQYFLNVYFFYTQYFQ